MHSLLDGSYSSSESTLSNEVFGNGVDAVNLVERYESCSFNQLRFGKASDRTGSSANIRNGVVTVTLSGYTESDGDARIRNAVTSALNNEFGVFSPTQLANHVMYCLPDGAMSGIAYAYVNSWNSVYKNQVSDHVEWMHATLIDWQINLLFSSCSGATECQRRYMKSVRSILQSNTPATRYIWSGVYS